MKNEFYPNLPSLYGLSSRIPMQQNRINNQGRPKLFRPSELIQTPILIPAELNSKGEKCLFRSNSLQNTL